MGEEPDRFKEIMEEIFDIKIELIQAFSDLGKKFDNLINARAYFQSEPKGMTVPQDYDPLQTPKKESKIKTKVTEQTESKLVIVHEGRTYARFNPCKYKCGMWSSFANDYKKGDRPIHINPVTREVLGGCPKYE